MFLEWAKKAERDGDFLAARMNYMKWIEDLKVSGSPAEVIESASKEYETFVRRDPVFSKLIDKLLPFIKSNPGVLQSDITKHAASIDWSGLFNYNRPVAKEDLYYALYFADKFGMISRRKKGRSYELKVF